MKRNRCIDCNKLLSINPTAKRCKSCHTKYCHTTGLFNVKGINNPNYKDGKPKCLDCGKELKDYNKKRCWDCYVKWSQIPENNPNWIDGRSFEPYSSKFTPQLKEQIRKRDNYTCQNCGMTEEEHLIVYGEFLNIHHIDYDKENLKDNNLISVCRGCNLRANYNRDYWYAYYTFIYENIYLKKGE
jgi:5-methylcytosine-specific restriction endonuclease McrA